MTLEEIKNNIGAAVKLKANHGSGNRSMTDWNYNWRLGYIVIENIKYGISADIKIKDNHSIKKFGGGNLSVSAEYLELYCLDKNEIEALIKTLEL